MHQVSRSLGLIWSDLSREPIFRFGLVIKLFLVIFLIPEIQQGWFVPFMVNWIESPALTPWTAHLSYGGSSLAFPYGPIMFIAYLPSTFLGWIFDSLLGVEYFASFGFRISLFFTDIFLLMLILQVFEDQWKKILIY